MVWPLSCSQPPAKRAGYSQVSGMQTNSRWGGKVEEHAAGLVLNIGPNQEGHPYLKRALNWRQNPERSKDRAEAGQTSQSQKDTHNKGQSKVSWKAQGSAWEPREAQNPKRGGQGCLTMTWYLVNPSDLSTSCIPIYFLPQPCASVLLSPSFYRRENENKES